MIGSKPEGRRMKTFLIQQRPQVEKRYIAQFRSYIKCIFYFYFKVYFIFPIVFLLPMSTNDTFSLVLWGC